MDKKTKARDIVLHTPTLAGAYAWNGRQVHIWRFPNPRPLCRRQLLVRRSRPFSWRDDSFCQTCIDNVLALEVLE